MMIADFVSFGCKRNCRLRAFQGNLVEKISFLCYTARRMCMRGDFFMSKLGEQIYRYRTKMGLSQQELAEKLEVSRQSVSKWEVGGAVPDLERLMKMAALFGVTLDDLVSGEGAADQEECLYNNIEKRNQKIHIFSRYWRTALWLVGIGVVVSILYAVVYSFVLSANKGYPLTIFAFPLSFHLLNIAPFLICAALCFYPPKRLMLSCMWVAVFAVYMRLDMHFAVNWYDAVYTVSLIKQGQMITLLLGWLVLLLFTALLIFTVKTCFRQVNPLSSRKTIGMAAALLLAPFASWLIRCATRTWRDALRRAYPNADDAAVTVWGIRLLEWACDLAVLLCLAYCLTRMYATIVSKREG